MGSAQIFRRSCFAILIATCGLSVASTRRHTVSLQNSAARQVASTSANAAASVNALPYQLNFEAPPFSSAYGKQVSGAGFRTVAVGDFNGDGITDFATAGFACAEPGGDSTAVFLGDGHGGFQPPVIYAAGGCVQNIAVGRLRGNNAPQDLAFADLASDHKGVDVLLGNGDGTFQGPILVQFPTTPGAVAIADVNGDGKGDLIVVGATDGQTADSANDIAVLLGHGDGTFDPPVYYANAVLGPQGVAVADLNKDGEPDLIVRGSYQIGVALGNGGGTFLPAYVVLTEPSTILTVTPPGPIASGLAWFTIGDFNEDGILDIAAAESGERIDVLLGTGTGSFLAPITYLNTTHQTGFGGGQIATGKLSNSGHLDLVVNSGYGTTLAIFRGNGDGTFSLTPDLYPLPQADDEGIILTDVNGDGLTDIVVGTADGRGTYPNYLTIMLNRGNGDFGQAPPLFSIVSPADNSKVNPTNAIGITLADLTGNGTLDLITTDWDFPVEAMTNGQIPMPPMINPTAGTVTPHASISVFAGNGDGTFQTEHQYEVGTRALAVQAADLTGDGKKDLVVVSPLENNIALLKGNGDRTFQPAVTITVGTSANSVTVADLNGDGKPDIVVTNLVDNTVSVLINQSTPGTFNFNAPVNYSVGTYPAGAVARDFNHDGKLDLAVVCAGYFFASDPAGKVSNLSVLLGNGDGTFAPAATQPIWSYTGADAIVAGDFGRGETDLAVANFGWPGQVLILRGDGHGGFTPAGAYDTGNGTEGLIALDFNGDGKIDLAASNLNDYTIMLLVGNGDGTFVPAAKRGDDTLRKGGWTTWGYPAYIAAGDLTGDGKPDILASHIFEEAASVLRNTTTGVPISRIASRKTHGEAGPFDIDLTGGQGIECRSGGSTGDYEVVFTFVNALMNVGGATVATGTGSVVKGVMDTNDPHNYVVNLTGVANAQKITVSLTSVTDSAGNSASSIAAAMGILLGDVDANGRVDGNDVSAVQSHTRQAVNSSNVRFDVEPNGRIDGNDVSITQGQTRTALSVGH